MVRPGLRASPGNDAERNYLPGEEARTPTTPTHLTDRFGDAMQYALELHRNQQCKGGEIPYIAHLLAVTALVLEDGGTEDEAIAALLHDAVEDQPDEGPPRKSAMRSVSRCSPSSKP